MNIKELFELVAKKYGIDGILEHIKNEGRKITYIKMIDGKGAEIESGNVDGEIEAKLKRETNGIYGLYADSENANAYSGNPFIVFGLKDSLIPVGSDSISEETELICLHELCHMIEIRKYKDVLKINFNEEDVKMGKRISSFAQDEADRQGLFQDIFHNEEFGSLLNNLIRRKPEGVNRNDKFNARMVQIALSKTLIDYPLESFTL